MLYAINRPSYVITKWLSWAFWAECITH